LLIFMIALFKNSFRVPQCITVLIFFLISNTAVVFAQSETVDMQALSRETQKVVNANQEILLIWYIPHEYWKSSFQQNKSLSPEEIEKFMKIVKPYTLFLIVEGKIGQFGSVDYKDEKTIRQGLKLKEMNGSLITPIADDEIKSDMKNFLSLVRPILTNMLGPMGQNMNFFVFPSLSPSGKEYLNPVKDGNFSLFLSEREFKWRLPLGALMPKKKCPVDEETFSCNYKFCPFHGNRLE